MSDLPSGSPRLVVTGGGDPTPEQLAAIVVALTPTAASAAPGQADDRVPAWTRAALREGTGGTQVAAPSGLDDLAPRG